MRPGISLRRSLFAVGIAGIVCSAAAIYLLTSAAPGRNSSTGMSPPPLGQVTQADAGLPVRLIIPKIHVDAAIEHLGLTPEGAMAVPAGPADVAWYDLGPRPGEIGSAVIAGHVGWKDNIRAAFDSVASLRPGDTLFVEDAQGASVTFVVRELRMYDQNQNDSDVFTSTDGKAHLNLIACEGVWDAATKSYSKRLVIFTDKE